MNISEFPDDLFIYSFIIIIIIIILLVWLTGQGVGLPRWELGIDPWLVVCKWGASATDSSVVRQFIINEFYS